MQEHISNKVRLQLCPEDDSEHGEGDGNGQTQVQVEQDGAEVCHQPHQLGGSTNTQSQQVQQGSHSVKWSRMNLKGDFSRTRSALLVFHSVGTSMNCLNIPFKFTSTIVDKTA